VYRPDGSTRPVEEAPPLLALAGDVLKNQEEMVRTPATGEIRYRQVSSNPIRDAGDQIIGSVSVVRDIAEHKKAEEALRQSEYYYRELFNSMQEGFYIADIIYDGDGKPQDYKYLEINPAFAGIMGLASE
jgi:PAS domain-containing protein